MDENEFEAIFGSDSIEEGGGLFGDIIGAFTGIATDLLKDCESNCTLTFIGKPEQRLQCLELCSRPKIIQAQAASGIQAKDILIYGGLALGAVFLITKL